MTAEPRTITLPDGRRLAYAEFGAPDGRPLMLFPGTPGSHVLCSLADAPARARGIRVIAPDRPGIGGSDDQPGRRFGDWPADVACLADALGLERFAVAGMSGGGVYALACAARLADRVDRVGIVSGPGPYSAPGAFRGMPPHLQLSWRLIQGPAWLSGPVLRSASACAARFPGESLLLLRTIGPTSDRRVLGRADFRALFARDVRETFRHGAAGAIADLRLYAGAWDFSPAAIAAPVHLWHGAADKVIPPPQPRHVASLLHDGAATFVPDAGHFWFVDHLDVVLDAMFADGS